MSSTATIEPRHARAVRAWLIIVAALIFTTLIVGGATRLTEPREVAVGSVLRIGQTVVELQR